MPSDKIHSIDAHVPSDTEGFEKKAKEASTISPKLASSLKKVQNYAMYYAQNEKVGLGLMTMILEMYCQMAVMHATMLAHDDILRKSSGVKKEEMFDKIADYIEERLTICQIDASCTITEDGVFPVERPDANAGN